MTIRKAKQKRELAVANKAAAERHPALEKLLERLSAPRLKAPGTIASYLLTGANFLSHLKGDQAPTDSDFRQHFIRRRREGIGEGTLRKEFFHLQKLARANRWDWPFDSDDTPYDDNKKTFPPMQRKTVEQLIAAKDKLTKAERFYLAVATTWLVRRAELARIQKSDFDSETIVIHIVKRGKGGKHLIPDALKGVFADFHPKEHYPSAMSAMFLQIARKAGVHLRPRESWHGIRYTLNTILEASVPRRVLTDYAHWKTITNPLITEQNDSRGGGMIEKYRAPEILSSDPYYADKAVYANHPFLHLWEKKR